MTDRELDRAIEAVVLVAVEPVPPGLLAELLEEPVDRVEAACDRLVGWYGDQERGVTLVRIAGGLRYQTDSDQAPYVERFANRDVSHRLSTAALETLSIVAYRQPVSRAQIAALRGVNVDGVVRLLEQRGYIEAVGRAEGPGQPVLYGTTSLFLERLGLDRIDQLPPVEDFLPGPEVVGEMEDRIRQGGPAAVGRRGAGERHVADPDDAAVDDPNDDPNDDADPDDADHGPDVADADADAGDPGAVDAGPEGSTDGA